MPEKLTRTQKAMRAYASSIKRVPQMQIAEELGISRPTVAKLIAEERQRIEEDKDSSGTERDKAIATYEATIRKAWEELESEELRVNSLNRSGYLNTIVSAQKAIDEITGARAPVKAEVLVDQGRRDKIKESLGELAKRRMAG